jgi:hypothetical protein
VERLTEGFFGEGSNDVGGEDCRREVRRTGGDKSGEWLERWESVGNRGLRKDFGG